MLHVGGITLETVTKLPSYLYVLVSRVTDIYYLRCTWLVLMFNFSLNKVPTLCFS